MRVTTTVRDDLIWGEAPRWRGGTLHSSDAQGGALVSLDLHTGRRQRLDLGDSPVNGTWFLPTGELVAARLRERRLDVLRDGALAPYADLGDRARGTLGDMTGTARGCLFVDDLGPDPWDAGPVGRIIAVPPDGPPHVVAEDLHFPNGLALLGETLVVAETLAGRLTAFDVVDDGGRLARRRVWADLETAFGPDHRPDGIWAGPDGSVWVAATWAGVFLRLHGEEVLDRVDVPGEFAIACCVAEGSLFVSASHSTVPGLSLLDEALPRGLVRGRLARVDLG